MAPHSWHWPHPQHDFYWLEQQVLQDWEMNQRWAADGSCGIHTHTHRVREMDEEEQPKNKACMHY
jgi:hypothetical protein